MSRENLIAYVRRECFLRGIKVATWGDEKILALAKKWGMIPLK